MCMLSRSERETDLIDTVLLEMTLQTFTNAAMIDDTREKLTTSEICENEQKSKQYMSARLQIAS